MPEWPHPSDDRWFSATSLYLARRIDAFAGGRMVSILDVGCGDGKHIRALAHRSHELYGCDLYLMPGLETNVRYVFGERWPEHIRQCPNDRTLPFENESFSIVYANQVFEHVRCLEAMLAECARVLKPGGLFLINLPLATVPIEPHIRIPFVHWLPPGTLRTEYLKCLYKIGVANSVTASASTATENAIGADCYLRTRTFYRFRNEIVAVSEDYFSCCITETELFLRAKIDLMRVHSGPVGAALSRLLQMCEGPLLTRCVELLSSTCFCMYKR